MIVGTGRESTRPRLPRPRRAASGCVTLLVRTPARSSRQMTTDVFVRHYAEVADASPIPVLLYNVTMYTGVNLLPDAVARLGTHPNIVGMKESGSDLAQIADFIARTPDDFWCWLGRPPRFLRPSVSGAMARSCAAQLAPEACVLLQALVREGHVSEARELQSRLIPLARTIGGQHGVPALKAALNLMGYAGALRDRLFVRSRSVVDTLRTQLEALGLLERVGA